MMTTLTKASIEKFRDGCPACGSRDVEYVGTGRSIWFRPFEGGGGEVREVGVLFCPRCEVRPAVPGYGTPIYEDEVAEA